MLTYSPAIGRPAAGAAGAAKPAIQLRAVAPVSAAARALSRYREVDLEARVAAASPHGLVLMLFERLRQLLGEARAATARGDRVARCRAFEKALAVVDGLDMSLDPVRGGEVAATLHRTYEVLRGLIVSGSPEALDQAQEMADALADAWRRIGPAAGR